jgi:hypothetical protein
MSNWKQYSISNGTGLPDISLNIFFNHATKGGLLSITAHELNVEAAYDSV